MAGHDKADGYFVWPVRRGAPGTVDLPQTGQTVCTDRSGAAVACAGTGQDGESRSGAAWPSPRFVVNADGTLSDGLTGLVWSREGMAPGPDVCGPRARKTLRGALHFIACLNANGYLGKRDWRLPNRNELATLVNRGQADSAAWLNIVGLFASSVRQLLVVQQLRPRHDERVERQPARRRRDDLRQAARHQRLAGAGREVRSRPRPAAAVFCLLLASPLLAGAATIELPRTGQNSLLRRDRRHHRLRRHRAGRRHEDRGALALPPFHGQRGRDRHRQSDRADLAQGCQLHRRGRGDRPGCRAC